MSESPRKLVQVETRMPFLSKEEMKRNEKLERKWKKDFGKYDIN